MARGERNDTTSAGIWLLGALMCALPACGDDGGSAGDTESNDDANTGDEGSTGAANLPEGCDFHVEPSGDAEIDQAAVQLALIDVQSGQTVCLGAGTFVFTRQLTLDADGATVRGEGGDVSVLDFTGQISGGNGLAVTGNDVTLEDFGVINTPGDGIRAESVDNILFRGIHVIWETPESEDNGAYGLYPVLSNGVTIQDCLVQGSRDAGVYVGQSTNILVEGSEARGNVAGIEIENSTDAIVRNNYAHDNTAGVLVFNLPRLDVKDGKRTIVYDNIIENNNTNNFGEPGTVVAQVPPGLGVLILAADRNEVTENEIRGNDSAAVVVIAYVDDLFEPPNDPEFDIYAEGNYIHDNVIEGNGTNPADLILLVNDVMNPSPDILFDGCWDEAKDNSDGSLTNCVNDLAGATFMSVNLCNQGMADTDPTNHTCEHPALPRDL